MRICSHSKILTCLIKTYNNEYLYQFQLGLFLSSFSKNIILLLKVLLMKKCSISIIKWLLYIKSYSKHRLHIFLNIVNIDGWRMINRFNTVGVNYIGAPNMRNNSGAIKLSIFPNIELFSIAPCKYIVLNLHCFIFGIISFLLFFIALSLYN